MFVLDESGSMYGQNWEAVEGALKKFADEVVKNESRLKTSKISVIMFDSSSRKTHFEANFTS